LKKLPGFTAWGGEVQELDIFSKFSNKVKWLFSLFFIDYRLFFIPDHKEQSFSPPMTVWSGIIRKGWQNPAQGLVTVYPYRPTFIPEISL
jgi:hypothetical protein